MIQKHRRQDENQNKNIYELKENQNHSGCRVLHRHYVVVPRFHRNTPSLAGLDGESAVPACRVGAQRHCHRAFGGTHAYLRTHLLFGDLPVRSVPRHRCLAAQKTQPLHLLASHLVATLCCSGHFHHRPRSRHRFACGAVGTLQFLRTHSHQPVPTHLDAGQQRAGRFSRTRRQLRILQNRCVAAHFANFHHSCCHIHHPRGAGLEKWAHLLQHHLSRRHSIGVPLPFLVVQDKVRCRQMPRLQPVFQELQGFVHRLQDSHRGL